MPEPSLSLNQTALTTFQRCPEQYRRRWICGDIVAPSIALHRGTSVHAGAEHNFTQKIQTGKDLPKNEIVERAVTSLQQGVRDKGLSMTEEERSIGRDKLLNDAEKSVVSLSSLFVDRVAPAYQPTHVEEKIAFTLPRKEGDPEVLIHGRLDLVARPETIADLKTTGKTPSEEEYASSQQLTMYALLHTLHFKKPPSGINVEVLVDKAEPEHIRISQVRSRADFASLLLQIAAVARGILSGSFSGAYGQTGAWWCSKKFCGYWSTCPFVPAHRR